MDYGFAGTGPVTNCGNAPSGKTRYVEAGLRNTRSGHAGVNRDLHADSQVDFKNESANIDGKSQGGKQAMENGDVAVQNQALPQMATEDRKKLESPIWNETGILLSGVCLNLTFIELRFSSRLMCAVH